MKRILVPLAAALAILLGAMLPKGYLILQDHQLKEPISHRVEEPMLQYGDVPSTGAAVFGLDSSSEDIACRLSIFQAGSPIVVPLRGSQAEVWTKRAVEFLSAACEVPVEVISLEADYRLAMFEDGTAVTFWTVSAEFNQGWHCWMLIDDVSGAILCFDLYSDGLDLAELFPDSFEQGTVGSGTDFETLATRRVTDALSDAMGTGIDVRPGTEPCTVEVSFDDTPELHPVLFFTLDLMGGITFNPPMQFYLW